MLPYYYNSTVKRRVCPNCELKNELDGSEKSLSKAFKHKSGTQPPKKRKSPKSTARTTADRWFSRYIRIKYHFLIDNGEVYCRCFIYPSVAKHAKAMDNGHCFSRQFKATRYEEDNCRPQNRSSNRFSGEADHYKFKERLRDEIGEERFNRIDSLRKLKGEDNILFYRQQADKYKKAVYKLLKKHEIKKWW
jgi:hypothetical protein